MAKKTKTRTAKQRSAAAKRAWAARRNPVAEATPAIEEALAAPSAAYAPLEAELAAALSQSSEGKGKERHANDKPFDRQPIAEIGRIVGPGFNTGQAMKKAGEATQMFQRGEVDKAIHELHGAIVYLASACMLMRE
jgi:hypothetical protein